MILLNFKTDQSGPMEKLGNQFAFVYMLLLNSMKFGAIVLTCTEDTRRKAT